MTGNLTSCEPIGSLVIQKGKKTYKFVLHLLCCSTAQDQTLAQTSRPFSRVIHGVAPWPTSYHCGMPPRKSSLAYRWEFSWLPLPPQHIDLGHQWKLCCAIDLSLLMDLFWWEMNKIGGRRQSGFGAINCEKGSCHDLTCWMKESILCGYPAEVLKLIDK